MVAGDLKYTRETQEVEGGTAGFENEAMSRYK
jgi:hypothetical protein